MACTDRIDLDAGDHTIVGAFTGRPLTVDRVVLSSPGQADARTDASDPTATVAAIEVRSTHAYEVDVDCPAGCWLVFGMGHNTAWEASRGGEELGEPVIVDGGFNGWKIAPTAGPERISIGWTAQRPVTIGLAASAVAALGLLGVLFATRRRVVAEADAVAEVVAEHGANFSAATGRLDSAADTTQPASTRPAVGRAIAGALAAGAVVAVSVAPFWGIVVAVICAAELALRHRGLTVPLLAPAGIAAAVYVGIAVALIERRDAPFPNAGWTVAFDHLHGLALAAVALVALSALLRTEVDRP